jgi:hypothetical protein
MRVLKWLFILVVLSTGLMLTSCNLSSFKLNNDELVDSTDEYCKNVLDQIIEAVENNDRDKFIDSFSDQAKSNVDTDNKINEVFQFYKGKHQTIDYNYSVETDIIEDSKDFKFFECLAFVKTNKGTYTFEFLICKNDEYAGVVSLILSTEKNRDSSNYSDFVLKVFDGAEYFDEDCLGVFVI